MINRLLVSLLFIAASLRNGVSEHPDKKHLKGGVTTPREPKQLHRKLATVTYSPEAPNSTPLTNPERGFYSQDSYRASFPERLDVTSLASDRDETGQSIILRLYYLDTFLNGPISQEVLDDVEADFATMRAAGVKCVLRFAYTDDQGASPTEPSKSILLNHIAQLSPILTANQDAILAVQAGFVGPWGEWHGSTNFSDDLDGRKAIVSALLDAVPERTVQIRTPLHKQTLYGSNTPPTLIGWGYVTNGEFEGGSVGLQWSTYMDGFSAVTSDFNGGSQSVKVTNGAAKQWIDLPDVVEGNLIELTAYSKRVGATGPVPWDYAIYADVKYSDHTYLWGQLAKFSGSETWNKAEHTFEVPPGKTVVGMSLYCMYRNVNDGYALFDDVAVSIYSPPSIAGGDAVDATNAHDGSHISRTGHHNDCFLASETDYGTYTAPHSPTNTAEYDYLHQETKYTSMGGETCAVNPPRSECDKAKEELELFHYTYLNSGYNQDVLSSWGDCMDEITARLGYRLVLHTGTFGPSAAPGGTVPYSILFSNVGYAAPVTQRPFQLVLRETATGAVCAATDSAVDVRSWFGGKMQDIEGNLVLPTDIPEGTYELYLNLADESEDLRTDINFKMKVANMNLNDEATGLIDLQHSIIVAAGQSSEASNAGPDVSVVCGMEDDVLPPLPPAPTIVQNGGFEGDPEVNWSHYMNGYTVDTTFKHSGDQSIKIVNGGAKQWVSVSADANSQVTIRGYGKAVDTTAGQWDHGLYADVAYADGSYLWGQIARLPGGTHDWTLAEKTFIPTKDVIGMSLYAMARNVGGETWYDDIEVIVEALIE